MDLIGLQNYINLLTRDPLFWTSLYNTGFYVFLMVPLTTVGAIIISVLLNQRVYGSRVFRTVFYMPSVLSGVAMYVLWMRLLSPSTGLVNIALGMIGIDGPAWLFDPMWTKPAIIFMRLWSVGGNMLLYLGSLQSIPTQLYESADLDGANPWHKFLSITLPMITPVIFFDVVTSLIGGFQIFQEGYVMSEHGDGGPMNSLLFYNLRMWNVAFEVFNMGYAMSMAWILFVIVMIFTALNMAFSKYWVYYEGGDGK